MSEATSASGDPSPDSLPMPERGSLLGVDYGRVRIGIAVCDNRQSISSPLEVIVRRRSVDVVAELRKLVHDYEVVGLVVGLPLHANGDESEMSREARRFAGQWGEQLRLPVTFFDERYTSAQAEDFLLDMNVSRHKRQHGERDMLAAHFILASYLQEKRIRAINDSSLAPKTDDEPMPDTESDDELG